MSVSCLEVNGLLSGYGAETLAPAGRRELREHLARCAECRGDSLHRDVGLLFAGTPAEEVSADETARILSGVRAGISWKQAERRLAAAPARPRRRGLIAAAAAVVAFTLAFPGARPRPSPAPRSVAERVSLATPRSEPLVPVGPSAVPAREVPNSKTPSDATIYDWNPGGGQPRVVWIVDRSLDI